AETLTAFGKLSVDTGILGNAEAYVEFLATRRKSNQDGNRQFTLDYPFGSPLIPAELRFATAALGPQATNPGVSVGIRAFTDYGIYQSRQTVDYVRLNAGLRGDITDTWRYELFIGKSWNDGEYTSDLILTDRLNQSMDVVASGSGFVCRNATGGCVAAPALTPSVVGGQFPAPWFDFVTDPITGNTAFRESTAAVSVDGPLFAIWGGDVQVALGAEYRKSSINDTPSTESQRGNLYGFTSSTITRGSDAVKEVFGEIEIPLVRDSFIYDLTLNGSARYTHYDSYGGAETWKIGGTLAPVQWMSFRGSYGTSYRAPALFEQFLGATSGFLSSANDPCTNLASVTNPLILAQCQADGLPANFIQNSSITVIGLGGAAAGLEAETSKALTFGGVLQPDFGDSIGDISLAVDYFRIKVDNGVAQLSAATVLAQCYNNPERTTCSNGLITRQPYTGAGTGQLSVIQSFVNISDAKVRGIDFAARYSRDIGAGKFRLNANLTKFLERYSRTLPTQTPINVVGELSNPQWTGTFDASYARNGWNFRYGVEWIDATTSNPRAALNGFSPLIYDLSTPDYFLHTASIRYEQEKFGITLGVRNIFNRTPPTISSDWTNTIGNGPLYSGYDFRGRSFFINMTAGFK
ncbi:MAG: hypothetical protein RLZZ58_1841, partial [Pseudomonadota bacterium]